MIGTEVTSQLWWWKEHTLEDLVAVRWWWEIHADQLPHNLRCVRLEPFNSTVLAVTIYRGKDEERRLTTWYVKDFNQAIMIGRWRPATEREHRQVALCGYRKV